LAGVALGYSEALALVGGPVQEALDFLEKEEISSAPDKQLTRKKDTAHYYTNGDNK